MTFEDWVAPMLVPLPELPEGMHYNEQMQPAVECCGCGNLFEWPCEIEAYSPDVREHHYCGGSPRCCP